MILFVRDIVSQAAKSELWWQSTRSLAEDEPIGSEKCRHIKLHPFFHTHTQMANDMIHNDDAF